MNYNPIIVFLQDYAYFYVIKYIKIGQMGYIYLLSSPPSIKTSLHRIRGHSNRMEYYVDTPITAIMCAHMNKYAMCTWIWRNHIRHLCAIGTRNYKREGHEINRSMCFWFMSGTKIFFVFERHAFFRLFLSVIIFIYLFI